MKFINLMLFTILLIGCGSERRNEYIYLYSKDRSQVVTIITDVNKNQRIIANGKHKEKPKKNYYLLDISNITELGDDIGICFKTKSNTWEIVNHKAKVLKVQIDTVKYVFRESLFEDKMGVPNTKYYIQEDCFIVGTLNYTEHFPEENGTVERLQ
nr:hypothetical protein [uncultured Allomuricauda sp.]